jgi:2'-5' RNA ligase
VRLWEPIQRIRRLHDRQIRRWMPHINVLYPFLEAASAPATQARLREACRAVAPFRIVLRSLRFFRHGRQRFTMWLAPDPAEPIVALHRALLRTFPACDDLSRFPGGFTPHLSVGQVSGREKLETLLRELRAGWEPLVWPVSTVTLIRREGDEPFRIVESFSLGGQAPGHR